MPTVTQAMSEPSLDPSTPISGFCSVSQVAHCGCREAAVVRSTRYSVVCSWKNSQALGGQDVASTMACVCFARLWSTSYIFKYNGFGFPMMSGWSSLKNSPFLDADQSLVRVMMMSLDYELPLS